MNYTVSIIIPIYNVEKYLGRCLDSIIEQSYKDLEIILINDGSTDSSPEICEQYSSKDSRIKVLHQKNHGVAVARNNGLEKSTGDYISFVDADDWIHKDMYQLLLSHASGKDDTILIFNALFSNVNNKFPESFTKLKTEELDRKNILEDYLKNGFYLWRNLYPKELVDKVGFKEGVHITSDIIFGIDIIEHVRSAYYIDAPLYMYFVDNNESITRNSYDSRKYINFDVNLYLTNKTQALFPNDNVLTEQVRKRLMENIVYHLKNTRKIIRTGTKTKETIKFRGHLKEEFNKHYKIESDFSLDKSTIRYMPLFISDIIFNLKEKLF